MYIPMSSGFYIPWNHPALRPGSSVLLHQDSHRIAEVWLFLSWGRSIWFLKHIPGLVNIEKAMERSTI
jgi:hypothetical protein